MSKRRRTETRVGETPLFATTTPGMANFGRAAAAVSTTPAHQGYTSDTGIFASRPTVRTIGTPSYNGIRTNRSGIGIVAGIILFCLAFAFIELAVEAVIAIALVAVAVVAISSIYTCCKKAKEALDNSRSNDVANDRSVAPNVTVENNVTISHSTAPSAPLMDNASATGYVAPTYEQPTSYPIPNYGNVAPNNTPGYPGYPNMQGSYYTPGY